MGKIRFDKRNYRKHNERNKELIAKSLAECGAGRSILLDADDSLIAGNGVYEQASKMGIPVRVIETDGTELIAVKRTDIGENDDKRKRLALADNATSDSSEWDVDAIMADLSPIEVEEWDIQLPEPVTMDLPDYQEQDGEPESGQSYKYRDRIEDVEQMMNKAMQDYCLEFAERVEYCMRGGFLPWGKTPAYARLQFLKAKYYGQRYQRVNSLIFCPRQFYTSAHSRSYFDQLLKSGRSGAEGIAGFRTHSNDGDLSSFFADNYPVGVARMPLDFLVSLARTLIAKFANGGRVLDPCHGWGGRCTAALLEGVREYVGCDPSPVAHDGVTKIYETFGQYQDTKVTLLQTPYEEAQIDGGFDFALTSPPYFDVEQYEGEQQAHERYNNYSLWLEKFYKPLIIDTMARLKDGCSFALQVGSQSYPLKDDAIRIATAAGYKAEVYDKNVYKIETAGNIHNTDEERGECIVLITR